MRFLAYSWKNKAGNTECQSIAGLLQSKVSGMLQSKINKAHLYIAEQWIE